jgi:predicted NBD/HSP70 family sugar kinase
MAFGSGVEAFHQAGAFTSVLFDRPLRQVGVSGEVLAAMALHVARTPGISRRELGEALTLTPPTISKGLALLTETAHLIHEGAVKPSGGRPIGTLQLDEEVFRCLGVRVSDSDASGFWLQGTITTLSGRRTLSEPLERRVEWPSNGLRPSPSAGSLVDALADFSKELGGYRDPLTRLLGVGIQLGGHVNRGRLIFSPNLGLREVDLRQELSSRLGATVVVENDLTALTVREHLYGELWQKFDCYALVGVFEESIGAGLVVDGRVWRGTRGLASEPGHCRVSASNAADADLCRCGQRGCLQTFATPAGVDAALRRARLKDKGSKDKERRRILRDAGGALGEALVQLVHWIDPGAVMLHLPVALLDRDGGNSFFDAAATRLHSDAFSSGKETWLLPMWREPKSLDQQHARAAAAIVLDEALRDLELSSRKQSY